MALDDPHARPSEPPRTDRPGQSATRLAGDEVRVAGDEVLPCGRLLSQAWEQAQDATPTAEPHTV
ncbi:hypothetical protein ABZ818_41705, partial [Streptomyces sp. NPDC047453]